MPQEPKKRHSRQRQGKRRAAINLMLPKFVNCDNCNEPRVQHAVCSKCGFYKGSEVIVKKKKAESQSSA